MEENVITGLSISDDVLMVTISNLEFKVENIAIVFEKLAEANINVDMISQTGPINGIVNLSLLHQQTIMMSSRKSCNN